MSSRIKGEEQPQERVRASSYLTIFSELQSAEALATHVGLQPDESWSKGQKRGIRQKEHPYNAVVYRSGLDESASPDEHFSAIVNRLKPYSSRLRQLSEMPGNYLRLSVVEHSELDNIAVILDRLDLEAAASMGVSLLFDSYYYCESD